jgi:acyl-[acyl-carrier-protein]-phospholipid O-acyltransferase/long-chain-fatty-acid--[acyl-carrier-protein] ligase
MDASHVVKKAVGTMSRFGSFLPYCQAGFAYTPAFAVGSSNAFAPRAPKKSVATLFEAVVRAAQAYGPRYRLATDQDKKPLSYGALLTRSVVLARLIKRSAAQDEPIALMLPTTSGTLCAFVAIQALGRVAAMINFNAGASAILSACATAKIRTLFTSRRFIEVATLDLLAQTLEQAGINLVYMEDLRDKASLFDKLCGLAIGSFPTLGRFIKPRKRAEDPAVLLFTSGSEGVPKGVVLSHANILSNISQFTARIDLRTEDVMFACLPLYHSFGLTVGALLPLMTGMNLYFYPSPLHYHLVPQHIRESGATILLTTDTFLNGYARTASADDLATLRYIVAGAEKLKDSTRALWMSRFGKRVFEGYGATETAPVLSVNTPDHYKEGAVGQLLSGIEARLKPVPGIENAGSLCVKGPNIMLGYMKQDAPGIIQPPQDGWYDTGDIASLDEEGFLSIRGRLKRFAKIGGEMISLTAIENAISGLWPEKTHAVVSVPHARKGESIVLLTEQENIETGDLIADFRALGFPEIALPRRVIHIEAVPLLGAGKVDYAQATKLAFNENGPAPDKAKVS